VLHRRRDQPDERRPDSLAPDLAGERQVGLHRPDAEHDVRTPARYLSDERR
jgi:hypothetical protein